LARSRFGHLVVDAMSELPSSPLPSSPAVAVEQCTSCGEPFVVPVDILGVVGHWRYVVDLVCANCGWSGVQIHDDSALERLDRELDRQTEQMRAAIEVLGVAREVDRIDRFAQALHDGDVLPEDF
jgi:hypothetical protein